jgi:membrane associated rhomboid family serine protease
MFPLKDNIHKDHFPLLTVVLIAINVVVYLLAIRHGGSFIGGPTEGTEARFGAIPYELSHPGTHCHLLTVQTASEGQRSSVACGGQLPLAAAEGATESRLLPAWETVFTSMFMHTSILHIGFNMLFLGIFGPTIEDAMGRGRFVAFYLLGGVIALAVQVLANPSSTAPTLGASGAIAAVMGGYIALYPRARILTLVLIIFFFTVIELPAAFFLGFWFLLQLLEAEVNHTGGGGGVANFAHIGGFVFGLALIRAFARQQKSMPPRYPLY